MNIDFLIERARSIITEESENVSQSVENLRALLPSAIELVQSRLTKEGLKTWRCQSDEIAVENGQADLKSPIAVAALRGVRLDMLPDADVIVKTANTSPMIKTARRVASLDRLALGGIQDKFFVRYYFDGRFIQFRDPNVPVEDVKAKLDAGDLLTDPTITFTNQTFYIIGVAVPRHTDGSINLQIISDEHEGLLAMAIAEIAVKKIKASNSGKPPLPVAAV